MRIFFCLVAVANLAFAALSVDRREFGWALFNGGIAVFLFAALIADA